MIPKKIKEETEDRIVLVDSKVEITNLVAIVAGSWLLYTFFRSFIDLINSDSYAESRNGELILFMILTILIGWALTERLYDLLIKGSVTIDNRLQCVVTKKSFFFIKSLEYIRKIYFSDIKSLEAEIYDSQYYSKVSLITIYGSYVKIFDGGDFGGDSGIAREVAKKTRNITGKSISYHVVITPRLVGG